MSTPVRTAAEGAADRPRVFIVHRLGDEPMVRHRARIRFRKEGDLRLTGHHDLMHVWERLFRRAGWQLRMSTGFHPRPRTRAAVPPRGGRGAGVVLDRR